MKPYRFIGTLCLIGGQPQLDHFGQKIELDDATAKSAVLGGAGIVPDAHFAACDFTDDETARFANPAARHNAPESFKAKQRMAEGHRDGLVAHLRGGGSLDSFAEVA